MRTADLRTGDEVLVNVRGLEFAATYLGSPAPRVVDVEPLRNWVTYRRVQSRQLRRRLRRAP